MNEQTKDVQVWADRAMYTAVPTAAEGETNVTPKVYLLSATPDPLGAVAMSSFMYKGMPIRHASEITDEDRLMFFKDIQKTALDSPFEFIDFHFMIEGVTRAFTHQMVRQRVGAVYVQESQRFAVKENGAHEVALPPSLVGTLSLDELVEQDSIERAAMGLSNLESVDEWADAHKAEVWRAAQNKGGPQGQRLTWDEATAQITRAYMDLVNQGMPAEDARGLLPTNITTRIHYKTNLRALIGHAGNRLCTQAQFEWRVVWAGIVKAMRAYGVEKNEEWQWDLLSNMFKPVCYHKGTCVFLSDMDRHCDIRDRVLAFADHGVKSSEWDAGRADLGIPGIRTEEWLANPASARRKA